MPTRTGSHKAREAHLSEGARGNYLPEIDGLRAIAVAAVILFHLFPKLLPGGFVGVDIFFVLSGFLITRQLTDLRVGGRTAIWTFYQRRIARIAPSAFLVILAVLAAAALLFSTVDAVRVGSHGMASALSAVNILLIRSGSYFAIAAEARPLAHYWSLAVEEQFYLLYPLAFWLLAAKARRPALWLGGAALISFLLCVALTFVAQPLAFYLLPTRAWELLVGGLIAVCGPQLSRRVQGQESLILAAGLVLTLISILVVRPAAFPGIQALLPVAAAALVIAGAGPKAGRPGRWLASEPLLWVGKRSYLLYLWHWPVISLVGYTLFDHDPWLVFSLKLGLTLLLTVFSHDLVERPARRWLNAPDRRRVTFALFFAALALTLVAAQMLRSRLQHPDDGQIARGGLTFNPSGKRWLLVIGDSTALILQPELRRRARQLDARITFMARSEVMQLPGEWRTHWPAIRTFLGRRRPDAILVAEAWSYKADALGGPGLAAALREVAGHAPAIVLMGEAPAPAAASLDRVLIARGQSELAPRNPDLDGYRARSQRLVEQVYLPNMRFVPIDDIFQRPDGRILVREPGALLYSDPRHLSDAGLKRVYPRLFAALEDALAK
ncbi:acyltransferase [Sphingomonas piscis]|uniref:Acyltransferase n=1 Tax=Sphingomonas piscis TaxID=2714943 RepID=A0A6G7YQI0_9SPHN|nr:acyltransferase family protein [Sphingomonas piscis]QIK78987.1 acyltransferase [Sphingomonas piscis]